ncbi:MAG: DedA family protein [Candidatus Schekmanbacteria bacterium]|nr:DedA family protein [Candidatus Schekmanbacteria bacterium]
MDYALDFIADKAGLPAYLAILVVLLLCGVGFPLPEDIPLLVGGYLAHQGDVNLYIMIAVGMFGVLCGDFIIFSAGRRFGMRVLNSRMLRRVATPLRLLRVQRLFDRHGDRAVFLARFIVGLRPIVFATAGTLGMSRSKFLLYDGAAAAVSVPVWIVLAYVSGPKLDELMHGLETTKRLVFWLVVGACAIAVALWKIRQRSGRPESAESLVPDDVA